MKWCFEGSALKDPFSHSFLNFFFMQTHEKETQLGNYVLCAKSAFVRQGHHVLPES